MDKKDILELKDIRIRITDIYYKYFNNKAGDDFQADVILREEIKRIEVGEKHE